MNKVTPVVLIICDGWGSSDATEGNAIAAAHTPKLDELYASWPHSILVASGEAVGLPAGQQGNSEVGHLTIGSGRIIRQPLSRQNYEIREGIFYENEVLIQAIELAKERGTALHILGLVSPGGVHSHSDGALALVRLAKKLGQTDVHIHAFTDGRDTPPQSALAYIKEFEDELGAIGVGRISSVSGRYYAMDRDNRWDRVELAYDILTGTNSDARPATSAYIESNYRLGVNDEFLKPVSIKDTFLDETCIKDGDVVIFFNFRPDRARELSHALVDNEFTAFERKKVIKDLHFVSFTEYDPELGVSVAFPNQSVAHTLAEVVADHGLRQYHVAETEKYAHVTYFLNGGIEQPFPGEARTMIPSVKVATYDLQPEMSARKVADDAIRSIKKCEYSLVVINFANADMVGHTGNFEATVRAIETLDTCIGEVVDAAIQAGGIALMTADHGNAEIEIDSNDGSSVTSHTTSPVPVLICGSSAKILRSGGNLADIAPTTLVLMGLPVPPEMTGKSLLETA